MATLFMVAVTVIAVGTVGVLVLDLGDGMQEPPPAAAFSFSYAQNESAGDELLITHVAGDELPRETIVVQYENIEYRYGDGDRDSYPDGELVWDEYALESQNTGDTVAISDIKKAYMEGETGGDPELAHLHLEAATVRIVWEGGSGSVIVDEWSGPDA